MTLQKFAQTIAKVLLIALIAAGGVLFLEHFLTDTLSGYRKAGQFVLATIALTMILAQSWTHQDETASEEVEEPVEVGELGSQFLAALLLSAPMYRFLHPPIEALSQLVGFGEVSTSAAWYTPPQLFQPLIFASIGGAVFYGSYRLIAPVLAAVLRKSWQMHRGVSALLVATAAALSIYSASEEIQDFAQSRAPAVQESTPPDLGIAP